MVLPSSGAISLGQIATEYSDSQPNSMNEFYRGGDNVPTTVSGSATQAAPSSNGTYTDFGGGTGLTLVRSTTSTEIQQLFYLAEGASTTKGGSSDTLIGIAGRGRDENGTITITGTSGTGTRSFSTGGTIPYTTGPSGVGNGTFTITTSKAVDIRLRYSRAGVAYTFTNNTGYDVTIEGTTVANDASSAISPSGDYNISYTITANANVPTSGTIDFADFYGGRAS
mgnify:CR=1 FL=1